MEDDSDRPTTPPLKWTGAQLLRRRSSADMTTPALKTELSGQSLVSRAGSSSSDLVSASFFNARQQAKKEKLAQKGILSHGGGSPREDNDLGEDTGSRPPKIFGRSRKASLAAMGAGARRSSLERVSDLGSNMGLKDVDPLLHQIEKLNNANDDLNHEAVLHSEDTCPAANGVLMLMIKDVHVTSTEHLPVTNRLAYFVEVMLRSHVLSSQVVENDFYLPSLNELLRIPVFVPKNPKHPFNLLRIRLCAFDPLIGSHSKISVGTLSFHLHDIMREQGQSETLKGTFDVLNRHIVVGEIVLEMRFFFGLYGFGYSPQFHYNTDNSNDITYVDQADIDKTSVYPRCDPPSEQMEHKYNVLIPKARPHPPWIPFNTQACIGYGEQVSDFLKVAQRSSVNFPNLKKRLESRVAEKFDRYRSITSREERLAFLRDEVNLNQVRSQSGTERSNLGYLMSKRRAIMSSNLFKEMRGARAENDMLELKLPPEVKTHMLKEHLKKNEYVFYDV